MRHTEELPMVRHPVILSLVAIAAVLYCRTADSDSPGYLPSYVAARHRAVIETWLGRHPAYRLAIDVDCSCADDLAQVRAAAPDYHPYYVVGDFRGNGDEDLALGVIARRRPQGFRVLIIHSTPDNTRAPIAFLSEELKFRQGLSYGPPRTTPARLAVGPFDSEGVAIVPIPNGYRFLGSRKPLIIW
jgi:hypothetical protein